MSTDPHSRLKRLRERLVGYTHAFILDGYHFRARVGPRSVNVEWVDCPSEHVPSGFSGTVWVAARRRRDLPLAWLRRAMLPPATRDQIEAESRDWLETVKADLSDTNPAEASRLFPHR